MIYLSGQTAADAGYHVRHNGIVGQAHAVYDNIETALKAVGAGLSNIVKTTTYLIDPAHIAAVRDVRIERYRTLDAPPANTLLIVNRLAEPEMLIEIDVIAAVPLQP
jgi:enamine deaminase RidA (YjgF/YER057c/UK114 family)